MSSYITHEHMNCHYNACYTYAVSCEFVDLVLALKANTYKMVSILLYMYCMRTVKLSHTKLDIRSKITNVCLMDRKI